VATATREEVLDESDVLGSMNQLERRLVGRYGLPDLQAF